MGSPDAYVLVIDAPILVVEFTVPGEPRSKQRPRFVRKGAKTITYTPQKTTDAEHEVAWAFKAASTYTPDSLEDAYRVEAEFHSGTRQRRDVDNMMKLILDGLNGVAWLDDSQVTEIAARKDFVPKSDARTVVRIYLAGSLETPTAECIRCGMTFRTYHSWTSDPNGKKYCSRKCVYAHRIERRQRTCEHCQSPFLAGGEMRETRYCSNECAHAARRTTVECTHCGTEFSKQKCHVRPTNFCSPECHAQAAKARRSKYLPGTCEVCGGGTTKKRYLRCNSCKRAGQQVSGKPKQATS